MFSWPVADDKTPVRRAWIAWVGRGRHVNSNRQPECLSLPFFRIPHNHIDITFHKHKPAYSETPPEWIHSVDPRFDLKREVVLEAVVRSRERVRQGHVSERVSE